MTKRFFVKHVVGAAILALTSTTAGAHAGISPQAGIATPPGVTLQNQLAPPATAPLLVPIITQLRFGDASGMTLYTFDGDTSPNRSACEDQCATDSPPVLAPPRATSTGEWSTLQRKDGTRQWAYRGKPLYRSTKDTHWGDIKGAGAAWRVARPAWAEIDGPRDLVSVREVAQAGGQSLVDSDGRALYFFSGELDRDTLSCMGKHCIENFAVFEAAQTANAVGAFTIVKRADGLQQWAYKNKPLYTFTGDVELGDVNGRDLDPRFQPAIIARYFTPAGVTIRKEQRRGGILETSDGKTLYARDTARFDGGASHNTRGGTTAITSEGLRIGLTGCDADCEKTFPPLLAGTDAQPSGYWTLFARKNGVRQWAYQGYALYTSARDQKPGDMIAHDAFDVLVVNRDIKTAMPEQWGAGLYWRAATP